MVETLANSFCMLAQKKATGMATDCSLPELTSAQDSPPLLIMQ